MPHSAPRCVTAILITALLCSTSAAALAADRSTDMADFLAAHQQFYDAGDQVLARYDALRDAYGGLPDEVRPQAAQLMSMAAATLGEYAAARDHYYEAFPNGRTPLACPADNDAEPRPAVQAVGEAARQSRVVLINESHSVVRSRALLHGMLPMLRQAGFTHLALEALAPASDAIVEPASGKPLQDAALPARGYPLDRNDGGYYLREPVMADLVRTALALDFRLVAYETLDAKDRPSRETGQATALAQLLDANPDARVLVVAGYSHIWKTDGWMAERLTAMTGTPVLSIDQIAGLWGCAGERGADAPYVLMQADGSAWSHRRDAVDLTVIAPVSAETLDDAGGWMTLDGTRRAMKVPADACAGQRPCLVSAYHAGEADNAVPADRMVINAAAPVRALFLKPGRYRVVSEARDGTRMQHGEHTMP